MSTFCLYIFVYIFAQLTYYFLHNFCVQSNPNNNPINSDEEEGGKRDSGAGFFLSKQHISYRVMGNLSFFFSNKCSNLISSFIFSVLGKYPINTRQQHDKKVNKFT